MPPGHTWAGGSIRLHLRALASKLLMHHGAHNQGGMRVHSPVAPPPRGPQMRPIQTRHSDRGGPTGQADTAGPGGHVKGQGTTRHMQRGSGNTGRAQERVLGLLLAGQHSKSSPTKISSQTHTPRWPKEGRDPIQPEHPWEGWSQTPPAGLLAGMTGPGVPPPPNRRN